MDAYRVDGRLIWEALVAEASETCPLSGDHAGSQAGLRPLQHGSPTIALDSGPDRLRADRTS